MTREKDDKWNEFSENFYWCLQTRGPWKNYEPLDFPQRGERSFKFSVLPAP